jgi:hypothetical protein
LEYTKLQVQTGKSILDNLRIYTGEKETIKDTLKNIVDKLTNENYDAADPYGEEGMETPLSQVKGGLVHKIGHILQMIFGINILTFGLFGTFMAWLTGIAFINPAMSIIGAIVGFIVVHIIRKISATINPVY